MEKERNEKKQIPLRLSKRFCDELSRWAEDNFRSFNGQIEYILTEAVLTRRKRKIVTLADLEKADEKNGSKEDAQRNSAGRGPEKDFSPV